MSPSEMRILCPWCSKSSMGGPCYCSGDGCGFDECPMLGDPSPYFKPPVPRFKVDEC